MKGTQPIIILGLSVSLALHVLALILFYIIGFQGSDVRLYETNILIAQSEFFLVIFGFSINMFLLKTHLRRPSF